MRTYEMAYETSFAFGRVWSVWRLLCTRGVLYLAAGMVDPCHVIGV
jgi:hypothetical protein